ncbi:hypothetical protein [Nocardioides speluncae]|uniref:hypothetical protein n=1 Tax=Nocardioides speluncae TaxID=2670337 RepID=UPI000D696E57|nr:hypothetical protein [Nocardioides speluncae]
MAQGRLNRDQFFDKLGEMDETDLKKALWTLYWRGAAPLRERVEAIIDPQSNEVRARAVKAPPDPKVVLGEVRQFATLARSGSYLAGDRRVSPKERSRWRHTFRRLSGDAQDALRGDDFETAAAAVAAMIDLACETRELDYFRSEDPLEAARFVVSDAVAVLWSRMREVRGAVHLTEVASAQLLSWESRYGWTRRGDGWVSARETSLATVLSELLVVPDLWTNVAGHYLDALDRVAGGGGGGQRRGRPGRQPRTEAMSEWNGLLVERLAGSDHEQLLDRLVAHPALAGPELTFVQARLARARGDLEAAGTLVQRCLTSAPGHPEYRLFAEETRSFSTMTGSETR